MMRHFLAILCVLTIGGCNSRPSQETTAPYGVEVAPASQTDLAALKQQVDRLSQDVASMNRGAELKLGSKGFSTIHTEYGAITIQWIASKPIGAGSKLTFKIGNPHNATLSDIDVYGHPVGTEGNDVESKTLPWKLKADAPPGSWSDISTIIDDVPPGKIASLRVSGITIGAISLKTP